MRYNNFSKLIWNRIFDMNLYHKASQIFQEQVNTVSITLCSTFVFFSYYCQCMYDRLVFICAARLEWEAALCVSRLSSEISIIFYVYNYYNLDGKCVHIYIYIEISEDNLLIHRAASHSSLAAQMKTRRSYIIDNNRKEKRRSNTVW